MTRLIFFIFASVIFLSGTGQEEHKYSFIDYNQNRLYFGKDSSSFMRFYEKLDSLAQNKKKQIVIAHIGGSHVQGGTWSNTFIADLQTEFKPAGGGYFIFPYKMAKTNSPHFATSFSSGRWKKCRCVGKEYCLPLGMSGMSVSTNDSADVFGIAVTKKAVIKGFNSVRVYHNFNSSFEFGISSKHEIKAVRMDRKELGYTQFDLETTVDSIAFEMVRKDTLQRDFTLYGYSLESNLANGIYLAALGANGATSSSFLRCNHFVEQMKTIRPDLVIMSLGVNDTQAKNFEKDNYIDHYDSLIANVRQANPDVAILLTTTTDNFVRRRTANKRPVQAKDAMFELMEKQKVAVWDLYSVMGGYKSMLKWVKVGLGAKDRVHFSPKGYTILGNLMAEALLKSYHYNIKK